MNKESTPPPIEIRRSDPGSVDIYYGKNGPQNRKNNQPDNKKKSDHTDKETNKDNTTESTSIKPKVETFWTKLYDKLGLKNQRDEKLISRSRALAAGVNEKIKSQQKYKTELSTAITTLEQKSEEDAKTIEAGMKKMMETGIKSITEEKIEDMIAKKQQEYKTITDKKNEELTKINSEIEKQEAKLAEFESYTETKTKEIKDKFNQKIEKNKEYISETTKEISSITSKIGENNKVIEELNNKLNTNQALIAELKLILGQDFPDQNIEADIKEKETQKQELENENNNLNHEKQEHERYINKLKQENQQTESKMHRILGTEPEKNQLKTDQADKTKSETETKIAYKEHTINEAGHLQVNANNGDIYTILDNNMVSINTGGNNTEMKSFKDLTEDEKKLLREVNLNTLKKELTKEQLNALTRDTNDSEKKPTIDNKNDKNETKEEIKYQPANLIAKFNDWYSKKYRTPKGSEKALTIIDNDEMYKLIKSDEKWSTNDDFARNRLIDYIAKVNNKTREKLIKEKPHFLGQVDKFFFGLKHNKKNYDQSKSKRAA